MSSQAFVALCHRAKARNPAEPLETLPAPLLGTPVFCRPASCVKLLNG